MKIVIVNGSPRKGNTYSAINAFVEGAKDNIFFQVINTLQNEDMLRDMPHREFQDLSIIYRWVVKVDENGIQSSAIRNNLAEQLGMNEEQLFKCAVENTSQIHERCHS